MSREACGMPVPRQPCSSCPWITTNQASDIPKYDHARAEALSRTCPDEQGYGPEFGAPMFACHQSVDGKEIVCASWLSVMGPAHPGVRLALATGALSPEAIQPAEERGWPALHQTFAALIEKLRATRRS